MLGEHLQAGRITRERETPQRVEPFPGALPQLRVEAPAPASFTVFTVAQPMRTASGMASARDEGARAASREPATRNHKLGK